MTRREEIVRQAEMFRQPYRGGGNYSTSMDIKNAFQAGAKWADKTMIDKACEWIKENFVNYTGVDVSPYYIYDDEFVEDFRKAMEK